MTGNPVLVPLGDCGLLVRFGERLDAHVNIGVVAAADALTSAKIHGVVEISPTLVSVFVRYDPNATSFMNLSGRVRLVLSEQIAQTEMTKQPHRIPVEYGGEWGPDLAQVAAELGMPVQAFVAAHNEAILRVLAVGFAPGFVYCGMHEQELHLPRRQKLHERVEPGSVIFAAGQTAITATGVPTGWHVIGRTSLKNFQQDRWPPTTLNAGDMVSFVGGVVS